MEYNYVYFWKNNELRARLKGRACKVVKWGKKMNSVLVEFEDGLRVLTSRNAIRLNHGKDR